MLTNLPNGPDAVGNTAVKGGRATRIADYTKAGGHHIPGRHAGTLKGQARGLKAGLRGSGIKVGKSNKGIGTAKQQVSPAKAAGRAQAWRNQDTKGARKIMGGKQHKAKVKKDQETNKSGWPAGFASKKKK